MLDSSIYYGHHKHIRYRTSGNYELFSLTLVLIIGVHVIKNNKAAQLVIQTMNTLHGSLVAIIFFWKSSEARNHWRRYWQSLFQNASSHLHSFYGKDSNLSGLSMKGNHNQISSLSHQDALFTDSVLNIDDYYGDFRNSDGSVGSEQMIGSGKSTPVNSGRLPADILNQAMARSSMAAQLNEVISPMTIKEDFE
jgi:hypothetical protein